MSKDLFEKFNNFVDDEHGGFEILGKEYSASDILMELDFKYYEECYVSWLTSIQEQQEYEREDS